MKLSIITAGVLGLFCACETRAASTPLTLRFEPNAVYIHNGTTSQTIENTFGTNSMGLAFKGSQTYDFYSPAVTAPISLDTSDKAGGLIVMSNSAPTSANDFTASASMSFYDYDPVTGLDTLIVEARQPAGVPQKVVHGEMAKWILVQAPQRTVYTLPTGHLLHIAVNLVLNSGDPGSFGSLLYNGPHGVTTTATFPRNSSLPLDWNMASVVAARPTILSLTVQPDQSVQLNCSCGAAGYYLIQASANINDPSAWTTISTNLTDVSGNFQFSDTDAPNHPFRFYRIAAP
jgi:hypothetical protein